MTARAPLPVELLDRIITLTLTLSSMSFSSISSLSLSSKKLRELALRRFFRHIVLKSKKHWAQTCRVLSAQGVTEHVGNGGGYSSGGFMWTRSIHASALVIATNPSYLVFLTHLQSLTLDFSTNGLATQHPVIKLICQYLLPSLPAPILLQPELTPRTRTTDPHSALRLTSLTLTALPRIDTALLTLLAKTFPALVSLHLSCTERLEFTCCEACLEESATCIEHSPIPDVYADVEGLANAFAHSLKLLTNLTHLNLGIFLSDEVAVYALFWHGANGDGIHIQEASSDEDNGGSCTKCINTAAVVRPRELVASLIIARKLKALRTIGWSTLFHPYRHSNSNKNSGSNYSDSDCEVKDRGETDPRDGGVSLEVRKGHTTVLVLRGEGFVQVRRMPTHIISFE